MSDDGSPLIELCEKIRGADTICLGDSLSKHSRQLVSIQHTRVHVFGFIATCDSSHTLLYMLIWPCSIGNCVLHNMITLPCA